MTVLRYFVFYLFIIFSVRAAGTESVHPCDLSCPSPSSEARRLATLKPDGAIFSIIDLNRFTAHSYRVNVVFSAGEPFHTVDLINSTSNALGLKQNIFDAVRNLESVDIQVRSDLPQTSSNDALNSAADMLARGAERDVGTFVVQNVTGMTRFGAVLGALGQAFGVINASINIVIDLEFSDGSSASFKVTGVNSDGSIEVEYLEDSALTSDGVRIPNGPQGFNNGRFDLREEQLSNGFEVIANAFDILLTTSASCTARTFVTCSATNGEVSCTRFIACP